MELEKSLIEIEKSIVSINQAVSSITISNTSEMENAVSLVKRVKEERVKLDEEKAFHIKPLKEHIKKLEAELKPKYDILEKIEGILKGKMVVYTVEQDNIRKEQEEKLRIEQQKKYEKEVKKAEKKDVPPPPPPAPIVVEKPKIAGFSMREIWDFEIVDVNLIPKDYLVPDEKKIRKVISAGVTIPGVKSFKKMSSAVSKSTEEEI